MHASSNKTRQFRERSTRGSAELIFRFQIQTDETFPARFLYNLV